MAFDPCILDQFRYEHLPEHLQEVSRPFGELAIVIFATIDDVPQRDVAFQKLLEAKDAAVRAFIQSQNS